MQTLLVINAYDSVYASCVVTLEDYLYIILLRIRLESGATWTLVVEFLYNIHVNILNICLYMFYFLLCHILR